MLWWWFYIQSFITFVRPMSRVCATCTWFAPNAMYVVLVDIVLSRSCKKTLKLKSVSKTCEKDFEFVCGVVVLMYILTFSKSVGERVVYIYRLNYCT